MLSAIHLFQAQAMKLQPEHSLGSALDTMQCDLAAAVEVQQGKPCPIAMVDAAGE
jgi:hypothetical protein